MLPLVLEYLFGGRKSPALFGVEFDLGTSTGQRNFTLENSNKKIGDILQKINTNYLYGGNVYFSDGGEEGFNWSVGLMTGTMAVKQTFQNGNVYDGMFKNGKMNGQGSYTFINGNLYIGEFKDGKRHGLGVFTYKNGNKYVGEFLDGNMDGQGTFTYPNGDKRVGVWKDGKPVE